MDTDRWNREPPGGHRYNDDDWARVTAQDVDTVLGMAESLASARFESWCSVGEDLDDVFDDTDALQIQLQRWQLRNFGLPRDVEIAHGVIEELGETFIAEDADKALDGLGDTMVYAGQLAISNRLALAPVLALAEHRVRKNAMAHASIGRHAAIAPGLLSHAVLKREQKIRAYANNGPAERAKFRLAVVDALGWIIAHALLECELGHDIELVDLRRVYEIVGCEVMRRDWKAAPETGTIIITTIEVPCEDPDRFIGGVLEAVSKLESER